MLEVPNSTPQLSQAVSPCVHRIKQIEASVSLFRCPLPGWHAADSERTDDVDVLRV